MSNQIKALVVPARRAVDEAVDASLIHFSFFRDSLRNQELLRCQQNKENKQSGVLVEGEGDSHIITDNRVC